MSHYKNAQIHSVEDLKSLFPDGKANDLNWCLFSTSGVHGSNFGLDEIEYSLRNKLDERHIDYCPPKLTVLVIKPRLVSLGYGDLEISLSDITFLRCLVNSSLEEIRKSQVDNI
jgi:hypothetical protein